MHYAEGQDQQVREAYRGYSSHRSELIRASRACSSAGRSFCNQHCPEELPPMRLPRIAGIAKRSASAHSPTALGSLA